MTDQMERACPKQAPISNGDKRPPGKKNTKIGRVWRESVLSHKTRPISGFARRPVVGVAIPGGVITRSGWTSTATTFGRPAPSRITSALLSRPASRNANTYASRPVSRIANLPSDRPVSRNANMCAKRPPCGDTEVPDCRPYEDTDVPVHHPPSAVATKVANRPSSRNGNTCMGRPLCGDTDFPARRPPSVVATKVANRQVSRNAKMCVARPLYGDTEVPDCRPSEEPDIPARRPPSAAATKIANDQVSLNAKMCGGRPASAVATKIANRPSSRNANTYVDRHLYEDSNVPVRRPASAVATKIGNRPSSRNANTYVDRHLYEDTDVPVRRPASTVATKIANRPSSRNANMYVDRHLYEDTDVPVRRPASAVATKIANRRSSRNANTYVDRHLYEDSNVPVRRPASAVATKIANRPSSRNANTYLDCLFYGDTDVPVCRPPSAAARKIANPPSSRNAQMCVDRPLYGDTDIPVRRPPSAAAKKIANRPPSRNNMAVNRVPSRYVNALHGKFMRSSAYNNLSRRPKTVSGTRTRHGAEELMDNYAIGKHLGEGAYAQVYHARYFGLAENHDWEDCAVKVYDKRKVSDPTRCQGILNEIEILSSMDHPNIVRFYEAVERVSKIFLVMEYCSGGSLFALLHDMPNRTLEEEIAKNFFQQTLVGLQYLHGQRVAHRDIKLENILIDATNSIKIIDLGFAIVVPPNRKLKSFCGTPSYMSPEIVSRREYVPSAPDMWAMGVLLYTMLAGNFPFRGENDRELYRKISRGVYPSPPDVSSDTRQAVRRMLEVNMDKRASVDDILAMNAFLSSSALERKNSVCVEDTSTMSTQTGEPQSSKETINVSVPSEPNAKAQEMAIAKLERLGYPRREIMRQLKHDGSHLSLLYSRFLKAMNAWG